MRTALIDLDSPPEWWKEDNSDFLSAQEARDLVNTTGEAQPSCPFSVQETSIRLPMIINASINRPPAKWPCRLLQMLIFALSAEY